MFLWWKDNSENETGFEVHRSEDTLTGYILLAKLSKDIISYFDTTIVVGMKYFYKIRAVRGDEYSDFSNVVSIVSLITYVIQPGSDEGKDAIIRYCLGPDSNNYGTHPLIDMHA